MILETERLILRRFVPGDAGALAVVLGDAVAMEFYPAAFDRTAVEQWIAKNVERYRNHGHGLWAMLLKESRELIGDCGCTLQEVEGKNEIEVGYHVRRDLWGRGYATEAARACIDYGFQKLGARRVISMIRPENARSIRVAEKNGMAREKIIFWRGYDTCIYVLEKAEMSKHLDVETRHGRVSHSNS